MNLIIDTEKLMNESFNHMESTNDIRWPIGMALELLYPEIIEVIQTELAKKYEGTNK